MGSFGASFHFLLGSGCQSDPPIDILRGHPTKQGCTWASAPPVDFNADARNARKCCQRNKMSLHVGAEAKPAEADDPFEGQVGRSRDRTSRGRTTCMQIQIETFQSTEHRYIDIGNIDEEKTWWL